MPLSDQQRQQFDDLVKKNKVVLFMKGNKHFPQCGFSAQVIGILKETGAPFETVNVLSDPAVRDGIKEYSSWPTIPQLYVDGEFLGGCDIVKEMYAAGDLQKKLGVVEKPRRAADDHARRARGQGDQGRGRGQRRAPPPRDRRRVPVRALLRPQAGRRHRGRRQRRDGALRQGERQARRRHPHPVGRHARTAAPSRSTTRTSPRA